MHALKTTCETDVPLALQVGAIPQRLANASFLALPVVIIASNSTSEFWTAASTAITDCRASIAQGRLRTRRAFVLLLPFQPDFGGG